MYRTQNIPSCIPIGTNTAINNNKFRATNLQSFGTAYGTNLIVNLCICQYKRVGVSKFCNTYRNTNIENSKELQLTSWLAHIKINEVIKRFNTGNLGSSTNTPCESAANHMWPWLTNVSKLILPNPASRTECFPRSDNEEFRSTI